MCDVINKTHVYREKKSFRYQYSDSIQQNGIQFEKHTFSNLLYKTYFKKISNIKINICTIRKTFLFLFKETIYFVKLRQVCIYVPTTYFEQRH